MKKERPILFNAEMVNAILDGRKTQTRRIVKQKENPHVFFGAFSDDKNDPYNWGFENPDVPSHFITIPEQACPYGKVGDLFWVRETWRGYVLVNDPKIDPYTEAIAEYIPDEEYCTRVEYKADNYDDKYKWKPSIHMPRWTSRITLKVTDIHVERLNDISRADAIAEGFQDTILPPTHPPRDFGDGWTIEDMGCYASAAGMFQKLWCEIYGYDSWDANPWVWVIEFERGGQ